MFRKKTFSTIKIKILIIVLLFILLLKVVFTPRMLTNIITDLRIYTCQINLDKHKKDIFLKVGNLFEGSKLFLFNGCKYPVLKIDTNFTQLKKLRNNRDLALKNGALISSENVNVPASATWNNKKYKIKMKLKGARIDHIYQNKKWSLKIEVKNDKSINTFKEFSITKPSSRQFPDTVFFSKLLENYEIKTPKFLMVNLIFNGENWGLMLIEEHFSSSYKELKKLRDVPIMTLSDGSSLEIFSYFENFFNFKIPDYLFEFQSFVSRKRMILTDTYNLNKYISKNDINSFNLISFVKTIHEISLTKGDQDLAKLKKYFNLEQIGLIMASNLAWGESNHSISDDNFRIYVNPFTQKIEYVPTDHYIDINTSLKNKNELIDIVNYSGHFSLFLDDNDLKKNYLGALKILKKDLRNHKKISLNVCNGYIKVCAKKFTENNFKDNIKYLELLGDSIFQKKTTTEYSLSKNNHSKYILLQNEIDKFDYQDLSVRVFTDGSLEAYNLTPFDVKIKEILFKYKKSNYKNCNLKVIKLENFIDSSYSTTHKKNTINIQYTPCLMQKVLIKTLRNNIEKKIELYVESKKYRVKNFNEENKKKIINYPSNWNISKKNITLPVKKINIYNPIVIKNRNLIINPGTEIIFSKNSYIYINNGNLILNGSLEKPITLKGNNKDYWGGIFVSNSDKSLFHNATIKDTNFFNHQNIMLTGGVSFYKSNISISNSKFVNSIAEDGLNFVNSTFNIKNSNLEGFNSDGIDSDFSNGEINNVKFVNILGDALDLSGSKILVKDSLFNKIGDKAISNGEKSITNINRIIINDAKFGIANKDESLLEGSNIEISNSSMHDIISFNKKSYYDVPTMNLKKTAFDPNKVLIMKKNKAKINLKILKTTKFDPKALY